MRTPCFARVAVLYATFVSVFSSNYKLNLGLFAPRLRDGIFFSEGVQDLAAIIMAIKEINRREDLLPNVEIRIAVREDEIDFIKTVNTCQELSYQAFNNSGVRAVIGPFYDSSTGYTSIFFGNPSLNLPQISYKSTSAELGNSLIYSITRTSISEATEGVAIANLLSYFGWENVIVFLSTDDYGIYLSNEFYDSFKGTVLNKFSLWPGASDYSYVFDAVKQSPGVLSVFVMLLQSADAGRLIEQGYDHGLFHEGVQIIGTSHMASSETWQSMKKQANVPQYMKGVLAVYPTVNRNNSEYDGFVKRWRAQPSTAAYFSNGIYHCNDQVDDTGAFIYKNRVSPEENYVCTGLDFSSFSSTGLDIEDSALQAYDAVYALGYAFDTVVKNGVPIELISGSIVDKVLLNNVSFEGASGLVDFKSVGIGAVNYGLGDRGTGATYKFVNFDPEYYDKFDTTVVDNGMRTVILWSTDVGYLPCDPLRNGNCASKVVFNTVDNRPAIDVPTIFEVQLSTEARIAILVLTVAGMIILAVLMFLVFIFSDHKLIKAAQPGMLLAGGLGIQIAFVKVIVATLDVTTTTCVAGMWLGHLSFITVFGGLILKMWRVNKIVNSKLKRVRVRRSDLYVLFVICIILFSLVLVVQTLVGNPHRSYEDRPNGRNIDRLIKCAVDVQGVTEALYVIEGTVLFYGAYQCWKTKDAPAAVNDSTAVSMGMQYHSFYFSTYFNRVSYIYFIFLL